MPARKPTHPVPGKAHLLDQSANYPCPCRRQGELRPIALTDAFGCQRCQQIFVIKAEGYAIEELSSIYPYRKSWYWNGQQWILIRPSLVGQYWLLGLLVLGLLLLLTVVIWAIYQIFQKAPVVFWAGVAVMVVMGIVSFWPRRR